MKRKEKDYRKAQNKKRSIVFREKDAMYYEDKDKRERGKKQDKPR